MNLKHKNHAKKNLERYLKTLPPPSAEQSNQQVGKELLTLIFAYARKQAGLHLRWHPRQCEKILFFTAEELFARKGKDPILNKAYDALEKIDPQDTLTREALLELAEQVLEGIRARNKAIAKRPRQRIKHPLRMLLDEIYDNFSNHNHQFLREKLILQGLNNGLIYEVDELNKKIICKDASIHDIKFTTIRDWISEIKKLNK